MFIQVVNKLGQSLNLFDFSSFSFGLKETSGQNEFTVKNSTLVFQPNYCTTSW